MANKGQALSGLSLFTQSFISPILVVLKSTTEFYLSSHSSNSMQKKGRNKPNPQTDYSSLDLGQSNKKLRVNHLTQQNNNPCFVSYSLWFSFKTIS